MNIMRNPAVDMIIAAFALLFNALESETESQVRFPTVKNWWDRPEATAKPPSNQRFLNTAYYYPYLCSIVFYNRARMAGGLLAGEWVSTCTILTEHWVVFSADNMDRPSDNHKNLYSDTRYHHTIKDGDLKVVHGSVYGSPPVGYSLTNTMVKNSTIIELYYMSDLGFLHGTSSTFTIEPRTVDESLNVTEKLARNPLGDSEIGVAFAQVRESFVWDAWTLPAPMVADNFRDVRQRVGLHHVDIENFPNAQRSCYVGYYHRFTKKMRWMQVQYIPDNDCREVYCTYDQKACLKFPVLEYHACFKALSYGDLCPEDRGAAVYCPTFSHSIFAILTTAPNCGYKNLPNVYTKMSVVIGAFKDKAAPHSANLEKLKVYKYPDDLHRYTIEPPGRVP